MIIVKLMGGLGNQMFQYAAGKALALKHSTELRLDLSWFNTLTQSDTIRSYDLACFAFHEDIIASQEDLKTIKKSHLPSKIVKIVKSIYPSFQKNIILEKQFHYDPHFWESSMNAYLIGYWQSFHYFESFSKDIGEDFNFKIPMELENKKLSESILRTSSVSLHIRRGDYVTNTHTNNFHGTTTLDYYNKAIEYIHQHVEEPHIFIFSDDMEWVKENFCLSYPTTYIDHNTLAFEDMRLMSLCKHNIIANSSFSWWGAWLNNNPNKIVIAPKQWFNDHSINTNDLIPNSWLRI